MIDPPDLLEKVGGVTSRSATIQKLQEEDRQAAARVAAEEFRTDSPLSRDKNNTPLWSMASIPDEVAGFGADAIEEFAKDFARVKKLEVHAVLSWRIRF